jgi:YfiH family protein
MIRVQSTELERASIAHGFFGRSGGVSVGIYASLNCGFGSGDRREDVAENRARVARALGVADWPVLTVHQVHGTDVIQVADQRWRVGEAPRADALVTDRPGVVLGVLAADCAPVLLADAEIGVIGAAHAGWRGALAGVVEATVAAMERLGAGRQRIAAVVGPCIGPASYEVGPEFRDRFLAEDPTSTAHFHDGPRGRPHFDLGGFLAARIGSLGLGKVELRRHDTLAEPDNWFSYRRGQLAGEPDYGRQLSAIALRAD